MLMYYQPEGTVSESQLHVLNIMQVAVAVLSWKTHATVMPDACVTGRTPEEPQSMAVHAGCERQVGLLSARQENQTEAFAGTRHHSAGGCLYTFVAETGLISLPCKAS